MHELLLFGSVPAFQHDRILQVLAGVAAMQPIRVLEKHMVFKPAKSAKSNDSMVEGSQSQQLQTLQTQIRGDFYYLQLIGDLTTARDNEVLSDTGSAAQSWKLEDGEGSASNGLPYNEGQIISNQSTNHSVSQEDTWQLQFRDLPEVAGRRPVTSRLMVDVDITCNNPLRFMSSFNHSHIATYILDGHRFIHNNIILLLHRLLRLPHEVSAWNINIPLELSTCPLLDPSGTWIMQASIRVQDGSKPEIMTMAMNELLAFKKLVGDIVDMEVGDRLALDTRFRQ